MIASYIIVSLFFSFATPAQVFKSEEFLKTYIYDGSSSRSYFGAKVWCEDRNATLVQLKSEEETNWIFDHIDPSSGFYLGVQMSSRNKNVTQFLDDSPITTTGTVKILTLGTGFRPRMNVTYLLWTNGVKNGRTEVVVTARTTQSARSRLHHDASKPTTTSTSQVRWLWATAVNCNFQHNFLHSFRVTTIMHFNGFESDFLQIVRCILVLLRWCNSCLCVYAALRSQ